MGAGRAMRERHTVRRFTAQPLSEGEREKIEGLLGTLNRQQNVDMRLVCDNGDALSAPFRLALGKNVRNYVVLSGPGGADAEERLGWCSCELMLRAQDMGLNTWWIGGMFSRAKVSAAARVPAGEKVIGIVVVGHGATQGKPHKSKTADQVSAYEGGAAPAWFSRGVEAALLAPTALNRQAFRLTGRGSTVRIEYAPGAFAAADTGIVKRHFELGAGEGSFTWA